MGPAAADREYGAVPVRVGEMKNARNLSIDRPQRRARGAAAKTFVVMLLLSMAAAAPAAALAFGPPPRENLTLQAPTTSVAGQAVGAVAQLDAGPNQPLAWTPVTLLVDTTQVATKLTDSSGRVSFTIPGSMLVVARKYSLTAVSGCGRRHGHGATATSSLTVAATPVPSSGTGPGSSPAEKTALVLSMPSASPLGTDVAVTASLDDALGRPVPGQHLSLNLNGVPLQGDNSGPSGSVSFAIPGRKLGQARSYAVQASFAGSHGYAASAATATLTVIAAAIQVVTLPPVPGLGFTIGDATAITGPDGVAALPVPASGTYRLTADLNPDRTGTTALKASFVGWADGANTASRTIVVNGPATYVMGVRIAYAASVRFVNMAGRAIDPALVNSATFAGADGTSVVLNPQSGAARVWWTASVAAATSPGTAAPGAGVATDHSPTDAPYIPSQLEPGPAGSGGGMTAISISYRPVSVEIHGVDALVPDQQAWAPGDGGTWTIRLAVYDLNVRAEDALFGAPAGGQVRLVWPNGSYATASTGADGTAAFAGVPAGSYSIRLDGSSLTASVPSSNSQTATIKVVTLADVLVAIATALGLLVLGLFALVTYRRRHGRLV